MSTKPETTFYRNVHSHLPRALHREKMSNPYQGGTWDCWYSGARDLWVEYKFVVLPKRDATLVQPGLSSLQLAWGEGRLAEGRTLAVIIGCREGGVILVDGDWECPLTCAQFKAKLLTRRQIAEWITVATSAI
jgi:hypothetical protein